ncbi:MAG: hypothetical protein U9N36_08110 [Euryarchaeota archaeon]|nr:hypothetical protein [Euryarchaeota archaeon]
MDAPVIITSAAGFLCAGGCELERDCGVCGGDLVAVVEVAAQEFITRSNLFRYARVCKHAMT